MSKIIATNIEWDCNNNDLPKNIEIPEGMIDEDQMSDYISEQTGYCHKGFSITCM